MLTWTFLLIVLAAAIAGGGLLLHSYINGGSLTSTLFKPKPERRLAVMEQASIDNRRRLILVRRDHVEHLIMTGGPVDVVIETGIGVAPARSNLKEVAESTPVFTRPPRTIAQKVSE